METSITFTLLYTKAYDRRLSTDNCLDVGICADWARYPAQPLYYFAPKDIRRFSYFYLLHYIHLYKEHVVLFFKYCTS